MNLVKDFNKISGQYDELNASYKKKESQAFSHGHLKALANWKDKRELNDAIHFLFIFSRFEDFIRTKSKGLIGRKIKAPAYQNKASWLVLNDYDALDTLHLMKRVQLFIDKGDHRFASIKEYYDIRNHLAHGGKYNTPINVVEAKKELLEFSSLFR